jgi:hypothetical protein
MFALVLGIGLVLTGVALRRGRRLSPRGDEPPAWVNSVDRLSPLGASIFAFTHATTSPKNLALAVAAARRLVEAGLSGPEMGICVVYYVAVASLTAVVPVGLYIFGGENSKAVLDRWRLRVTANAAAAMEVMLLIAGLALSVIGLRDLLA